MLFLFLKIVDAAREVTKVSDNDTEAVMKFKQILNSSEMYYNTQPFSKNESVKEADKKRSTIEGAKKYCPKRWEALQLWIADSRKVLGSDTMCFNINKAHGKVRVEDTCIYI